VFNFYFPSSIKLDFTKVYGGTVTVTVAGRPSTFVGPVAIRPQTSNGFASGLYLKTANPRGQ
jgi:hypothetical protein